MKTFLYFGFDMTILQKSANYLMLMLGFVAASCQLNTEPKRSVFTYNEMGSLTSLDPAFARNFENIWAVNQLYDGLLEFDNQLGLKPCLVDTYRVSNQGLRYTFYLKQNVFFHHDTARANALKASDVAFSLQRLISDELAAPGRWVMNDVERVNDSLNIQYSNDLGQISIYLKEPNSSFLNKLAMPYCKIVCKDYVENHAQDFYKNPSGTGPFCFFVWENRVNLVLHKNKNYHQKDREGNKLPYLDAIKVSFLKDPNAVFLSALNGQFHLVSGLTGEFKTELMGLTGKLKPAYSKDFQLRKEPYLYTEYIGVYLDAEKGNPQLQNPAVRQALSMAIDRAKMVQQLRGGIGDGNVNGMVPNVLRPNRKTNPGYVYNIEKAKEILHEALAGQTLGSINIFASSAQSDLCEFVQKAWSAIGFTVNVNIEPSSTLGDNIAMGRAEMFRKSWIADYPDPENFLSLYSGSNFSPNGPNYSHFFNPKMDSLYEALCQSTRALQKDSIIDKMEVLEAEFLPLIPLYYGELTHLLKNEVKGFESNSMNILNLKNVDLAPKN